MSMEVNGNYKDYTNDYLERLQEEREKAQGTGKEQGVDNKSKSIPVPKDEYISSERSGSRPSRLYRMGQDENGNPRVLYDDPQKAGGTDKKGQPKVGADSSEDAEECTMNTDKVDRELNHLKEQKQQLEQQIRAASSDEEKVKELEQKLSRIEGELSQKDNDTYRRQNAVIFQ